MRIRDIFAALLMACVLASSVEAQSPGAKPTVGIRSWGYQLQDIDPARLASVPYDAIVIDYSRNGRDDTALTAPEVEALKFKPDGTRRVVLAYMSIGEAESYRYYWRAWWSDLWIIPNFISKPAWRGKLNGDWGGNYAVRYWDPAWQDVIVGRGGYLDRILNAGFDGVWLDKVDSSLEDVAEGRATAKADMIAFVRRIADKGRQARPGFLVFPQNGEALLADPAYRALIDGFGKEDLLYGEDGVGSPNKAALIADKVALLKPLIDAGKPVLAVEYLDDRRAIGEARKTITDFGFVPHFGKRELASMRVGDTPDVASAAGPTTGKSRSKEPGFFEIWKTRVLIVAAGAILLLGLLRRRSA